MIFAMSRFNPFIKKIIRILSILFFCFIIGLVIYFGRRPSREPVFLEAVHPGINYYRGSTSLPYRTVYHLVEIDLTTAGLELISNDPVNQIGGTVEYAAATVSDFAEEFDTQIAINGNFFFPFYATTPISYYPRRGEFVEVNGLAINDGVVQHRSEGRKWPSLCIDFENRARIETKGTCPADTKVGLAGNIQTLKDGKQIEFPNEDKLPRTIVGVNQDGDKMWFLVIDGRQWPYSAGATHYFGQSVLKDVGAYNVLNLDGGGSTTLVMQQDGRQKLMNSPYHTRVVRRERPVANFLGVRLIADSQSAQ